MTKQPEQHALTEKWDNLARLYCLPEIAQHNRTRWSRRHFDAVVLPVAAFERALIGMLGGWLLYADAHQNAYESAIGDDTVLGKEWGAIGEALRGLLNGELERLDGGTLDSILGDTLQANGLQREDL